MFTYEVTYSLGEWHPSHSSWSGTSQGSFLTTVVEAHTSSQARQIVESMHGGEKYCQINNVSMCY